MSQPCQCQEEEARCRDPINIEMVWFRRALDPDTLAYILGKDYTQAERYTVLREAMIQASPLWEKALPDIDE